MEKSQSPGRKSWVESRQQIMQELNQQLKKINDRFYLLGDYL